LIPSWVSSICSTSMSEWPEFETSSMYNWRWPCSSLTLILGFPWLCFVRAGLRLALIAAAVADVT
jgi:hypothetical protein